MTTHTPLRLPETMTRADIGPYMRDLREHYGLTQQDVSDRLHIRQRYIHAIEHGAFDQMPGRAYAKGYVHTYAEFLGLDPDQAVEISFGPELVREQQKHFVPEPMKRSGGAVPGQWRGLVSVAAVLALLVLIVTQVVGGDDDAATFDTVAEVPEELLADMRRQFMPTAQHYTCLEAETALGCLFTGEGWHALQGLMATPQTNFAAKTYAGPLPTQPKVEEKDKDDEKKEDKKEEKSEAEKKPAAEKKSDSKTDSAPAKKTDPKPAAKKPDAKAEKKPAA